jgi:hypothetical protein
MSYAIPSYYRTITGFKHHVWFPIVPVEIIFELCLIIRDALEPEADLQRKQSEMLLCINRPIRGCRYIANPPSLHGNMLTMW